MDTTKRDEMMNRITYRGTCACGEVFGHADDMVFEADVAALHKAHERKARRKENAAGIHTSHAVTIVARTPELKLADEIRWKQRWAERLVADRIPARRMEIADRSRAIARRLTELADDVIRNGAFLIEQDPEYPVERAVQSMQHTVLWGLANLNLDDLVGDLNGYNDARRELAATTEEIDVLRRKAMDVYGRVLEAAK
jgi:hypothetical protein